MPTLLTALAWQESRFDPRARNRRSTARGLMQFTEATWLEAVRDHGPQHGLQYEAAVLSTDPASGSITTRQPRTRSRILELRDNPRYAAALAAARINRARIALAQSLGRPVGPADLYLVHLLGPAGAQRFLAALDRTPGKPAADFVAADSMALNREVFVERGSGRQAEPGRGACLGRPVHRRPARAARAALHRARHAGDGRGGRRPLTGAGPWEVRWDTELRDAKW